jgi:8-oxo-dGTP pyrophosphatase MutT (NUDIX family)
MERRFPTEDEIERALACRPHPEPAGVPLDAAVLVCLRADSILLVRRTVHAGDKWSGHMGLPGGRHESGDVTLLRTALRETEEELGFDALAHGRVVGALGAVEAVHRAPGDTAIGIFVARLEAEPALRLSDEIAGAWWVELEALEHGTASVPERPEPVPAFLPELDGRRAVVWGITYRILERLRTLA